MSGSTIPVKGLPNLNKKKYSVITLMATPQVMQRRPMEQDNKQGPPALELAPLDGAQMYHSVNWKYVKCVPPTRWGDFGPRDLEYFQIWSTDKDRFGTLFQIGHPVTGPNPMILFDVRAYMNPTTKEVSNKMGLCLGRLSSTMLEFAKKIDQYTLNVVQTQSPFPFDESRLNSCLKSDGKNPPYLRCKIDPDTCNAFSVNVETKEFKPINVTLLQKQLRVVVKLRFHGIYYNGKTQQFGPVLNAEQIYVVPECSLDVQGQQQKQLASKAPREIMHASLIGM